MAELGGHVTKRGLPDAFVAGELCPSWRAAASVYKRDGVEGSNVAGELAGDVDAAMAPLSNHPVWCIPGYPVEGREAVRALYEAALKVQPAEFVKEILRALDDPEVMFWGETHCVIEYSDAYPLHRGSILVVHFDGDRVAGEHAYQTTPDQIERSRVGIGAALDGVAGVTRVN